MLYLYPRMYRKRARLIAGFRVCIRGPIMAVCIITSYCMIHSNDLIICIIYASPIKERTDSMFIHDFRLFIFNLKCFLSFILLCNQFSQSILLNDPNSSTICFKIGRSLFRESSSFKAISSIILSAICLPLDTINDD